MDDFWMQKLKSLRLPDEVLAHLTSILRRIEHVWQRKEKKLRAINFSWLDQARARNGLQAEFNIFSNTVGLNPYGLISVFSQINSKAILILEHIIAHEIMHALSYRRIIESGGEILIFTGVAFQCANNDATKLLNDAEILLNEYITNFYSMRTMRAAPRPNSEMSAVRRLLADTYDDRLIGQIEKIVGEETLYHAYFNGQTDRLFSSLLAGGVMLEPFLAAIEKRNRNLTLALCFHNK